MRWPYTTFIVLAVAGVLWYCSAMFAADVISSRAQCQADNPGKDCRIVWEPKP